MVVALVLLAEAERQRFIADQARDEAEQETARAEAVTTVEDARDGLAAADRDRIRLESAVRGVDAREAELVAETVLPGDVRSRLRRVASAAHAARGRRITKALLIDALRANPHAFGVDK